MDLLSFFVGNAWAQDGAAPTGAGSQMTSTLLMVAIMFGIWYVLIIRPQAAQQKQHSELVQSLKKGDQVVTRSGMLGKVAQVEGDVIHLEVAKGVRIRVLKDKVARMDGDGSSAVSPAEQQS